MTGCWLVDLPGDGTNTDPPGDGADPYSRWPQAMIEAGEVVPNPVYAGHSTGGRYLQSALALEEVLVGAGPEKYRTGRKLAA